MLGLAFRLRSSLGSRQGAELHSQHRPSCREFVPGAAPGITCASGNPCLQPPATRGGSSPLDAAKGSPATQPPQHCRHTAAPGTPLPGVPCPLCHAGGLQNLLCTHPGPCSLPASALHLSPKALGVSTAHSRPDSASCPGTLGTRSAPPDPPHGIFLLPTGGTRAVPSSWAANRGIWGRVGTVPKRCPFPLTPARPALTVQLHARLGASALHLPPWGQRLLPSSRPPSMEGSCGAGSPRAAGTEGPGAGSTPRAARHGTALRPGRRAEAE